MNVAELIEELKKHPPEMVVALPGCEPRNVHIFVRSLSVDELQRFGSTPDRYPRQLMGVSESNRIQFGLTEGTKILTLYGY